MTEFKVESEFGFDLDAHNTTVGSDATPATGCGIEDGLHGIDNSFAALWDRLADEDAALDFNSAVTDALHDGSFEIMAYIRGYEEGRANDNIELTLIINRVEYPELVDVPATLEDGKIVARPERFPLRLSGLKLNLGDAPVNMDLTLNMRHVRIEIAEPSGGASSTMTMLGGAVQYYGDGGLSADLAALIEQLHLDVDLNIEDIVGGLLDISSDGTNCDSLSLGAQLRFAYNDNLCN